MTAFAPPLAHPPSMDATLALWREPVAPRIARLAAPETIAATLCALWDAMYAALRSVCSR